MTYRYDLNGYHLDYTPKTGAVFTFYPSGCNSGCTPVHDDRFHANKLGITPEQHRLLHELAHHLIGKALGYEFAHKKTIFSCCPIIFHDAHSYKLPDNACLLEWYITAVSYFAMNKPMRDADEWGAIIDIQKAGVNPYEIAEDLRKLVRLQNTDSVRITKIEQ